MKQVPYWRPTNIGSHLIKFSGPGDLAPGFVHPCYFFFVFLWDCRTSNGHKLWVVGNFTAGTAYNSLSSISRSLIYSPVLYKITLHGLEWRMVQLKGRAIAQEVRVRYRVILCGICGGQSGTGRGFSPSTSVFPCQFHSTGAPLHGKTKN
jgi:hypothetical protein